MTTRISSSSKALTARKAPFRDLKTIGKRRTCGKVLLARVVAEALKLSDPKDSQLLDWKHFRKIIKVDVPLGEEEIVTASSVFKEMTEPLKFLPTPKGVRSAFQPVDSKCMAERFIELVKFYTLLKRTNEVAYYMQEYNKLKNR